MRRAGAVNALAVDPEGRFLYWTQDRNRGVFRVDLKRAAPVEMIAEGLSNPFGLAILPERGTDSMALP